MHLLVYQTPNSQRYVYGSEVVPREDSTALSTYSYTVETNFQFAWVRSEVGVAVARCTGSQQHLICRQRYVCESRLVST